jgi:hypothetical protein
VAATFLHTYTRGHRRRGKTLRHRLINVQIEGVIDFGVRVHYVTRFLHQY